MPLAVLILPGSSLLAPIVVQVPHPHGPPFHLTSVPRSLWTLGMGLMTCLLTSPGSKQAEETGLER
jgi:hypothetical protein